MSACAKFRRRLEGAVANTSFLDTKGYRHKLAAKFLQTFDELHQLSQEYTGEKCERRSVGLIAAEKEMRERSKTFSLSQFNNEVQIICEDGSYFLLRNAVLETWGDDLGETWVFAFCEHHPDMVFARDDLVEYRQMAVVRR